MIRIAEELAKQKRITRGVLDNINKILSYVDELYPNEAIMLGEIQLSYNQVSHGNSHFGHALVKKNECPSQDDYDEHFFIPEQADEINLSFSLGYGYVKYINREDIIYIMKNIKIWVDELIAKETDYNKELEKLGEMFK